MDSAAEASTLLGEALARLTDEVGAARELAAGTFFERASRGGLPQLDAATAAFLSHAAGHTGFAAERNLWFNWPVTIAYEEGNARVANVNERIIENPYALRALAAAAPGARILDVGATENTLALSLASLGFAVTALDPRPYPLEHPNLTAVVGPIEDWRPETRFDAVLCISTLEHIGSGEYGQAENVDGDAAALARLHDLAVEDGLLVLTTPYGKHTEGEGARVYDRKRLEDLLADWRVEDLTIVERLDDATWAPRDEPEGEAVALVTARR
jgi:SAM-dependent methyltransferase